MVKNEEEFTFEIIAQVYREERNSPGLTKLPSNFYKNLMDYIEKLRISFLRERKDEATSSKAIMLEDEFNKAQRRAQEIYELRERKIVLLALSAVNGGSPNIRFITKEEKYAFDNLVDSLSKNRTLIFAKKEEDACVPKTFLASNQKAVNVKVTNKTDDINVPHKEEEKTVKEESESVIETVKQENPVLLILEDIPSFETEERIFNLRKDDTLSLPKSFAKILCTHGTARVIQDDKKINNTTMNS